MSGRWFSTAAAAERLGISRQAVLKAIAAGTLDARRHVEHGRPTQWFIDGDSLDGYGAGCEFADHLTVFDVAVHHRRHVRTVRGWIERGLLPAVECRGQWWVDEQTALDFTPPTRGRPRGAA